ncbi:hypothetical protein ABPG75_001656 [Micractinium tetrahymenae]
MRPRSHCFLCVSAPAAAPTHLLLLQEGLVALVVVGVLLLGRLERLGLAAVLACGQRGGRAGAVWTPAGKPEGPCCCGAAPAYHAPERSSMPRGYSGEALLSQAGTNVAAAAAAAASSTAALVLLMQQAASQARGPFKDRTYPRAQGKGTRQSKLQQALRTAYRACCLHCWRHWERPCRQRGAAGKQ